MFSKLPNVVDCQLWQISSGAKNWQILSTPKLPKLEFEHTGPLRSRDLLRRNWLNARAPVLLAPRQPLEWIFEVSLVYTVLISSSLAT